MHSASHDRKAPPRVIFITGTDTGVGKTLLTGLLLEHLRQSGIHALAMKPFCSGGTADVDLLHSMQKGELSKQEINPFYFPEPIAPLVSARLHRRSIRLADAVMRIKRVHRVLQFSPLSSRQSALLIEGSGGLLVPLGEGYTIADLIAKLSCQVIVVSRNRLGTINHTLMTVRTLQAIGINRLTVVIMNTQRQRFFSSGITDNKSRLADPSTASNKSLLTELLHPIAVREIPFLGPKPTVSATLKKNAKKLQKTLARICR